MLKLAVGSALLVTVTQGWALSLGATQGSVIIGRPLDVLVQSSIDASEAAAGLCLEAEVIYGENRVPASAVTTAIHRIGADGSGALRVRVSEPVSEPFVTLVLKAGCQQTFRRSYTLLADLDMPAPSVAPSRSASNPAAVPQSVPRPVAPAAPAAPVSAAPAMPAAAPVRPPSGVSSGVVAAAPLSAPAPLSETPIRLAAPAPRPTGVTSLRTKARPAAALPRAEDVAATPGNRVAAPAPTAEAEGARLKLDPVDVSPTPGPASPNAPDAVPQVDAAAASATTGTDSTSADAAAAPDVARELEQLRAEQEKLRVAMETMNAQLAQAEASRYQNPVVYGLGAAVIALLGGLWVLWRRRSVATAAQEAAAGANPWWETHLPEEPQAKEPSSDVPPAAPAPWTANDEVSGLEVSDARESMFREVPISPLNPEALLDVWQRVDFFESLGQHRDGMEALKEFVTESPRASEAPYLRWLALAKAHGEAEDRSVAQAFYEHHFQRLAPSAAADDSLMADAQAIQHLVAEWPEPTARRWLEQALASQPGDQTATLKVRSTEVFDEVLTLLGTLDVLDALPAVPELPVVSAPAGAVAATAVVAPDLTLDFPAWSTAEEVVPKTESTAGPKAGERPQGEEDRPPLDFDFFKWEPPTKPDGEASGDAGATEPAPKG